MSCVPLTGVEAEIGTNEATLKSQGMARGLISGRLSLFFFSHLNEKFLLTKEKRYLHNREICMAPLKKKLFIFVLEYSQ